MIADRIGRAPDGCGISGIPVQHEVLVRNRLQHGSRLFARCGVAGHLVLEQEDEIVFGAALRGLLQFGIDRRPVRLLIIQPPVVETANSVRIERFGKRDTPLQQLILCAGIEVRMKLVARFALRRSRSPWPVCLEQRACDIRDSQFVFLKDLPRILNLLSR